MLSMNLSELHGGAGWILFAVLALLSGIGLVLARRGARRQARELQLVSERLESLGRDMSALCAGSMGVDRRIATLERQLRALEQWRETMEARQQEDRPYGEAIQLVHKGASARELVQELGLSHSEAELVARLHAVDKAS